MTDTADPRAPLRAPHTVAFSYERSVGGATERFLHGLARAEVWGSRMLDGRVVVPPVDHDPTTGAPSEAFVRVGDAGVVRSWTWVAHADSDQPLSKPFAYALVQLDGADTSLLHVVDVAVEREMVSGMRVRADWREQRVGGIGDLRAFVPEGSAVAPVSPGEEPDAVTIVSDVHLHYTFEPGLVPSTFYRALGEGRIESGRCATCEKVFVPPHDRCPACGAGPMQPVVLGGVGTVVSFAVVHLPVHGMDLDLPFGWAWIRLDGADVPFAHLLGEVETDDICVGQRVEAVWEREPPSSWEAIRYFRSLTP
jgi:uncharacterized OB-fold protein